MAIIINLDVMLAKRKMKLNELSNAVGITPPQPFHLKARKSKSHKTFHPGLVVKNEKKPRIGVTIPWPF